MNIKQKKKSSQILKKEITKKKKTVFWVLKIEYYVNEYKANKYLITNEALLIYNYINYGNLQFAINLTEIELQRSLPLGIFFFM